MTYKRDRYLILDHCGVYMVRIVIPSYMKAYFNGKRYYMKSTATKDIRQARLFRDAVAVEFIKLREQLKPKQNGSKVEQIINELRGISNFAKESPVNYGANIERCPTLIQIRDLYLLQYSDKRKLTTLSKITKAVELILSHIKQRDSQLQDINRTVVTGWLDQLKKEKAIQTLQNYISALAQLFDFAKNRYHDAPKDNPFRGHRLEAKSSHDSYEPFLISELSKVFGLLNEEMKLVTLIGLYSGMRLNEICSLTIDDIVNEESVRCLRISKGKTKNAARLVPVHPSINALIDTLIQNHTDKFLFRHAALTDRADGKRSTWHTQQFTRAKRKALGEKETERKVFHSLRGMFITELDRLKVPEDRIALLVGHERGSTESFKTYSQGASLKELAQYVEKVNFDGIA